MFSFSKSITTYILKAQLIRGGGERGRSPLPFFENWNKVPCFRKMMPWFCSSCIYLKFSFKFNENVTAIGCIVTEKISYFHILPIMIWVLTIASCIGSSWYILTCLFFFSLMSKIKTRSNFLRSNFLVLQSIRNTLTTPTMMAIMVIIFMGIYCKLSLSLKRLINIKFSVLAWNEKNYSWTKWAYRLINLNLNKLI